MLYTGKDETTQSVYERKCTCCGRTFRKEYRSADPCSYRIAKEMADYNYSIHKLFCNEETVSMLKYSA